LTAYINARGVVDDLTKPFEADVRIWSVDPSDGQDTGYTDHGDLFVYICMALTVIVVGAAFRGHPAINF